MSLDLMLRALRKCERLDMKGYRGSIRQIFHKLEQIERLPDKLHAAILRKFENKKCIHQLAKEYLEQGPLA